MREGRASRTAGQNALFRALDARHPARTRIAEDTLAVQFLPTSYRLLVVLARFAPMLNLIETVIDYRWPCVRPGVVVRTRLLDETIVSALPTVQQLVILGAGFDTRAYRLPSLDTLAVFEVDHPSTQAVKQRTVLGMVGRLPSHVRFVPLVFGQDDPAQALRAAGFAPETATLVLWEGVTNYLDAEAVDTTFRFLGSSLTAGSTVLFTYVDRGIIDGSAVFEGAETTMRAVQRVGEPFTFGFDPPEVAPYLAESGFELVWDVAVSDAAARFYKTGRMPKVPAYYHVVEARRL